MTHYVNDEVGIVTLQHKIDKCESDQIILSNHRPDSCMLMGQRISPALVVECMRLLNLKPMLGGVTTCRAEKRKEAMRLGLEQCETGL